MLSKEDAQYIVDVILPRRELIVKRDRLTEAIKYANLLSGGTTSAPSCSCEFIAYWQRAYSIIDQHMDQVNAALAPTPTTRGRKKKK